MTTFDARATELFLEFAEPKPAEPGTCRVAIYNKIAYVSGALPVQDARLTHTGQIGVDVALVDKARNAARQAVITALGYLRSDLGDSLDTVKQVVKLTGYIACAPEFREHDKVFDRASDLLVQLFGTQGRHARSLIGVASLPKSAPVMVDLIVALK